VNASLKGPEFRAPHRFPGPCKQTDPHSQGIITVGILITVLVVVLVLALLGFALSVKIVKQYERGVLFRLGRVQGDHQAPRPRRRQARGLPSRQAAPAHAHAQRRRRQEREQRLHRLDAGDPE